MKDEFWSQVEKAYFEAAGLDSGGRQAYLAQALADRSDVRGEVESLLAHESIAKELEPQKVMAVAAEMFQDEDDLIGKVVGGKYRIREFISDGGQAEVYLADHIVLNMAFALKRPKPWLRTEPGYRDRFQQEAQRAAALKHENIARVYDVVEDDEDIFAVMDHIEGETLRARLQKLGRSFTTSEFLPIAIQCVSALAAAHERRIVHLDVKPENIMLTASGQVKICDFGIARRLSSESSTDTTLKGNERWTFAGTPAYMAPEVILSYHFDERADIFSLGIVFYEMLAGYNPFQADTVIASTTRIVTDTPPPISRTNREVNPKLERIVFRMLAKDPDQRYATAGELVQELHAVERSLKRLVDFWCNAREGFRESRLFQAVAAGLLLCILVLPFWIYRDRIQRWLEPPPKEIRALVPEKKNLVVLPFQMTASDPETQVYADGLTESVTDKLTQLTAASNLQVAPASEVRSLHIKTAQEARKELGANVVLAGTIYSSGTTLRIFYYLVDATTSKQLRTDTIEAEASDPFAFQDRIFEGALRMLELEVKPAEPRAMAKQGTQIPRAYDLYFQGRGYLQNFDKVENIDSAITVFQSALSLDVNYSLAYAGLGEAYWKKFEITKNKQWIETARQSCQRALGLDSGLATAHRCLGIVHEGTGEYQQAILEFNRALATEPTSDDAYRELASVYEKLGDSNNAEQTYFQAIKLRPHYWAGYHWLGRFYFRRGRYPEAVTQLEQVLALTPDNGQAYYSLGGIYLVMGRYEDSVAMLRKAIALRPTYQAYSNLGTTLLRLHRFHEATSMFEQALTYGNPDYIAYGNLAQAYYWSDGNNEKTRKMYERAISFAQEELKVNDRDSAAHVMLAIYHAMLNEEPQALTHLRRALQLNSEDPEYLALAATVHNQLGRRREALDWLEKAVAQGFSKTEVRNIVEFDTLREEPRYKAIMQ